MAIIRESTFRANPSAGGISCNWHFAQTSETDLAFMLLFEHRGNWLQRSLSPFPLPLAHKDSDLYSTHGFLPATYFNSYHSQTLNVCVLLRRGLSEVSVRCIFLLHVRSLPWWCLPKSQCHSGAAWLRRKRWLLKLAEVDLAFNSCKLLVQNQ